VVVSAAKYFVVGAIGTVTHLTILYFCVDILLISALLGSSIGFTWVVIQSYLLNRNWTFESKKQHRSALPRYLTVSCIGFLTNLLIMFVAVDIYNVFYMLAQTLTIIVVPGMNFLLNKFWAFS
jgi:putative flippase GtrA